MAAMTAKERMAKFRARQKKTKKTVHVLVSQTAHKLLSDYARKKDLNYSAVIDSAIIYYLGSPNQLRLDNATTSDKPKEIICPVCGGDGCDSCNDTGWAAMTGPEIIRALIAKHAPSSGTAAIYRVRGDYPHNDFDAVIRRLQRSGDVQLLHGDPTDTPGWALKLNPYDNVADCHYCGMQWTGN